MAANRDSDPMPPASIDKLQNLIDHLWTCGNDWLSFDP